VSEPKICPTCSAEYPVSERFCPKDGTALRAQSAGGTDLVGSVIAERYHVLRKLGEGGMGQVYLAEHVKMGRQSAVKVMHPTMVQDPDAIGRFNREAANASRIDHANVAGIYDFGETPEGLVYLAMQYVEGETLTEIVRERGALPPHRAAEIARQAAEGLHAAHAMGIVHRDLKPDNIMVTKDGDGLDCVKVVDFGIAKAAGVKSQKVTRTGTVIGTPEYMSPEQLAGEEVDGRSDLYSLALVAFNMLTGDLPFPAETTQTAMIMRLTEKPRSLAQMKPEVAWPSQVQAVMSKALEREASQRYASTREFGRALHMAIEKMPASAPIAARGVSVTGAVPEPATTVVAATSPAVMKRSLMIAAGVVGLLGALTGGVLVVRGGAGRGTPTPASGDAMPHVAMARRARELNDLATANREAVTAVQLAPNNGAALRELASTLFLQQNYNGARTFFTRAVKADPTDRLSQGFLGCSLIRLGRADEGMRWIQRAGNGTWTTCAPAPGSVAAMSP
jgi:serine/threonine-protein kinase